MCSTMVTTVAVATAGHALFRRNNGVQSMPDGDGESYGCNKAMLQLRSAYECSLLFTPTLFYQYHQHEHARSKPECLHIQQRKTNVTTSDIPQRTILATSSLTSAMPVDVTISKRRRLKFQWFTQPHNPQTRANHSMKSTWLRLISQTFFVFTRGLEIVVRFSPLLVLTPTAMLVTSADSWCKQFLNRKNYLVLSKSEGSLSEDDEEDNDFYDKQFQSTGDIQVHIQQQHKHNWASNLAWRYTLHTLQSLGPTFVKLGQWAATRRDLFPVHLCNRLAELHDMARTHDAQHTTEALAEAFGEDYESRGLRIMNDSILGSGSAAQVHKGMLAIGNGTERVVAIKVLHPHTRFLVERDLALMQHVADFIDKCVPLEVVRMMSLPRAVSNFQDIMIRQVDLRIEGCNLQTFRDNFDCSSKSPLVIDFPLPEKGWISERVLVEEYAGDDAIPISRYLADESPRGLEIRKKLAGPLLRAFLKMVFIDNFVHSDLHPGNVLVREIPNKYDPGKTHYTIIFLDAGIANSLRPNDQRNLHDLFKAVVLNDGYTAGQLMVERARFERCSSIPGGTHAFATGVSELVSEFHDRTKQGLTLGAVRVGSLLGRVLDLCRRYGVEIDPAMASVVVSMLVLEGLGRSLDSDLNLMKAAMPFLLGRGEV